MVCFLRSGSFNANPSFTSDDILGGAGYSADPAPDSTALFQRFDTLAASVAGKGYAFAALIDAQADVDADVDYMGAQAPNLITVDGDSSEGCLSGLRTCFRSFFAKLASWWNNGEANKAIRNAFRNAFESQLERISDESSRNEIAAELHAIADPSSGWPLDMRDVHQLITKARLDQSVGQRISIDSTGRSGAQSPTHGQRRFLDSKSETSGAAAGLHAGTWSPAFSGLASAPSRPYLSMTSGAGQLDGAPRGMESGVADLGDLIDPSLDAAFNGFLDGEQQQGTPSFIGRSLVRSRASSLDGGDVSDDEGEQDLTESEQRFHIPAHMRVDIPSDSDEDVPARDRGIGFGADRQLPVLRAREGVSAHAEDDGKTRDGDAVAAVAVAAPVAATAWRGGPPPLDQATIKGLVWRTVSRDLLQRSLSENLDVALRRENLMGRSVNKSVVTNLVAAMRSYNSVKDAFIGVQTHIHARFAGDAEAKNRAVEYLQAVRTEMIAFQQHMRNRR